MAHVDLGFIEKTESWLLKCNFFPSKVGGKPAWLDLHQIPKVEDLQCDICKQPLIFLCQIYAPIEEKKTCFHRTIFLFICRNDACCIRNENNNIKVFRCQLPRINEFYPAEPPVEESSNQFDVSKFAKLCAVCGIFASKHCSKCKTTSYCSRVHQIIDWKQRHKAICGNDEQTNDNQIDSVLFAEWELVIETEENFKEKNDETTEQAEERRLKEYENLVAEGKTGTMTDIAEDDLQAHAAVDEDKTFSSFRKRIQMNSDQILRYDRGGEPLWIASDPIPTEIPTCDFCNSPRQFEFQILPQLLYSLHENNLDWGTLAIYTCKNNCNLGSAYKKEYIFKQDLM